MHFTDKGKEQVGLYMTDGEKSDFINHNQMDFSMNFHVLSSGW